MRNARGKVTRRAGRPQIDEEERKRRAGEETRGLMYNCAKSGSSSNTVWSEKNGMWKYDCRCSAEREEMFSVDTCATLSDTCLTFRFSRLVHTESAIYSYFVFSSLPLFHQLFFVFFCFFLSLSFLSSFVSFGSFCFYFFCFFRCLLSVFYFSLSFISFFSFF